MRKGSINGGFDGGVIEQTKPINGRSGKDERDEIFVCARENEVRVRRGSMRSAEERMKLGFAEARYGAIRLAKLMGLWANYITEIKHNEAHLNEAQRSTYVEERRDGIG
ncbi:LOW QUALITY PROTEIN: hypothetical protein YC2023_077883 [Brassica napus]